MEEGKELKEELRNLISKSSKFYDWPEERYQIFHKTFLKYTLSAVRVEVDYAGKSISTWHSKPSFAQSLDLNNLDEALFQKVNYTNLEETLLGCLELKSFNEKFYQNLLREYVGISY